LSISIFLSALTNPPLQTSNKQHIQKSHVKLHQQKQNMIKNFLQMQSSLVINNAKKNLVD